MSGIVSTTMSAAMSVAQVAEIFHRSMRGLPKSADGLSDAQAAPRVEGKKDKEALLLRLVKGLDAQIRRGLPLPPSALPSIVDALLHAKSSQGIDDRKLLLEHVLALMSRMPPGPMQDKIQDAVIGLFYESLPHPPVDYLPSMAAEARLPTVVNGRPMGPGGAPISAAPIGSSAVATGGHTVPSQPTQSPTSPTTTVHPSTSGGIQTPTPASSGFKSPVTGASATGYPAGTKTPSSTTGDTTKGQQGAQVQPRKVYSTAYRTPSGAGNNPHMPLLGAAGTAYARSICSSHIQPPATLPDPNMVFELLMRRRDPPEEANPKSPKYNPKVAAEFRGQGHGQPHPSGLSTMLFAFGDLIIHSLFRTSREDPSINLTSSYLDLSPLYGVDETEMGKVRRNDGTGRLWEDVWADPRITMMPPAVGALLILFGRNHNFIAQRLLEINENREYTMPTRTPIKSNKLSAKDMFPELAGDKLTLQDDDIFNRARLINCAFFMNAILGDYLAGILGTFREANEWYLNPLLESRQGGKTEVNRAEGNSVSVEFNLLYRWHATLTSKDEQWLEEELQRFVPELKQFSPGNVVLDQRQLVRAMRESAKDQTDDLKVWTIGGLKRKDDGSFDDYELARIMHTATDTMACAYGARGIPAVMKVIEVMGMEQARKWGVGTMNEFRKFIGLKQYESFEEWNPTGDIAETARQLYQHIDNLELYVGLMCEESKQPGDGAGLCPGYTISRAILSDAVCLTRGDRFLTTDLTPYNLTAWGFQDAARDSKNGSMGGMICKLLFRTLPEYYKEGSVYAHFPFFTPGEMKKWLTNMNLVQRYNFTPFPDKPVRPIQPINTALGAERILKDMRVFRSGYTPLLNDLTGDGCFLSFDEDPRHHLGREILGKTLYRADAMKAYSDFYRTHTRDLIRSKSFSIGGKRRAVNIVRDVINIVPVHFICEEIAGLPLKSVEAPRGTLTEQEIYEKVTTIFFFFFLNFDPESAFTLRENATKDAAQLLGYILERIHGVSNWNSKFSYRGIRDTIRDSFLHYITEEVDHSDAFYKTLLENANKGLTIDQLASDVLGLIVMIVSQFTHATTTVLEFYLREGHKNYKKDIEALAVEHTPEANARLIGYVREALRFHPIIPGVFRKPTADAKVGSTGVLKNDRVFVSIANANQDPHAFPNPEHIDPTRHKEEYYSYGRHEYTCFDELLVENMIPSALRAVFSLKDIQPGPGLMGELNRFRHDMYGSERWLYLSNTGTVTPWPASLVITYAE